MALVTSLPSLTASECGQLSYDSIGSFLTLIRTSSSDLGAIYIQYHLIPVLTLNTSAKILPQIKLYSEVLCRNQIEGWGTIWSTTDNKTSKLHIMWYIQFIAFSLKISGRKQCGSTAIKAISCDV